MPQRPVIELAAGVASGLRLGRDWDDDAYVDGSEEKKRGEENTDAAENGVEFLDEIITSLVLTFCL